MMQIDPPPLTEAPVLPQVSRAPGSKPRQGNPGQLTEAEQRQVRELQARDREVRAHENAHKNAAGPYAAGGPTYTYQEGPDGQRYAVGGEVQIDTAEVPGDPQATLEKMQVVRRAALAPSEPSDQDRRVAAEASRKANQARAEINRQRNEENAETSGTDPASDSSGAIGARIDRFA